jgi:hypothetical protein
MTAFVERAGGTGCFSEVQRLSVNDRKAALFEEEAETELESGHSKYPAAVRALRL